MMRPILDKKLSVNEFKNYYWLKEELIKFCRENNIPSSGSKEEINERIYLFLETGQIERKINPRKKIVKKNSDKLSLDSIIEENYKNDENHRRFFKAVIGEHFKFNIQFMKWIKENIGKTYNEAVDEWNRLYAEKKAGVKHKISSQFEYNQYTRDFFKSNPSLKKSDAVKCWNYKKSLPGSNVYNDSDLEILK